MVIWSDFRMGSIETMTIGKTHPSITILKWDIFGRKNSVPWIEAIVAEKHSSNISKSPINGVNHEGNQHKSLTYFGFHFDFINWHVFWSGAVKRRPSGIHTPLYKKNLKWPETNPEFSTETIRKILQINDLKWWPKMTLDWEDIFEFRHLVYSENDVIDKLLALKVSLYFPSVTVHFYMYCSSSPFTA